MGFYDEWSADKLLSEMFGRLTIDKSFFLSTIGYKGDVNSLNEYCNFSLLSDEQLSSLKKSLDNFISSNTYYNYLRDEEDDEYVRNTYSSLKKKFDQEIKKRQPQRTNSN